MKTLFLLKRLSLLGWRNILTFIGVFLGFSSAVTAQYGVVENQFHIMGTVLSEDCHDSLPGIQLRLQSSSNDRNYSYALDETNSFQNGQFSLNMYHNLYDEKYLLFANDVDGSANGQFRDTVFVIATADLKFKSNEEGHWHMNYVNNEPLILQMKRSGPSPCREIPIQQDTIKDLSILNVPDSLPKPVDTGIIQEMAVLGVTDTSTSFSPNNGLPESFKFRIFPNPNSGPFNVEIEMLSAGRIALVVYDERLRKIFENNIDLESGVHQEQIDLSEAASGTYYLVLSCRTTRKVAKIIRGGTD